MTITNSSKITYTIDAANVKIIQGKNTISLSDVKIGDSVVVQGTVNGTSIVASTIIDQVKINQAKPANTGEEQRPRQGFLGSIGQFFKDQAAIGSIPMSRSLGFIFSLAKKLSQYTCSSGRKVKLNMGL